MEKGYSETTIREIAAACHMSVGTLYHYIGSKEDILLLMSNDAKAFLKEFAASFIDVSDYSTVTDKLRAALKKYIESIDEIQNTIVFWYQAGKHLYVTGLFENIFSVEEFSVQIIEEILTEGCQGGEFRVNNINLAANNIILLCDQWAFRRWYLRKRYILEEFIENQTELILNSLCWKQENVLAKADLGS
ncbi:MAG: TetR/AcrR family transcriptional regulator [Deltaproteobacteria bacterium]|nr:TetR/AcrR family transcriptional regulator [Deltaproteobacteria bacterium]MBW2051267.1 TetR/AcrR family transcriptional regulator [Deltaproteobacteria bacterium]MBW2139923.1 TetR/AcrR family transcriptional regulator [Deltaproteobacteria bacterium]MBW2322388.1 TetR/AcrR family transcriptional regulator [Deltaproteobacteria bacterium]